MTIFGQHEEKTLIQFEHIRAQAVHAALMADGHVGYVMPIGGVAAYDNKVSVVGVGFDIACGNAAIRTNLTLASFGDDESALHVALTAFADEIAATVSFGVGRKNRADDAPVDHALFEDAAWDAVPPEAPPGTARQGAGAARHGWQRQPLRGRVRRRAGCGLGRRALRVAWLRPHGRVELPGARPGQGVGRACTGNGGAAGPRPTRSVTTTGS